MYLADYPDPQLHGWLSKAVKSVTKVVTAPIRAVNKVVEKNTPTKLLPLVERVNKSIERGTAIAVNPLDAPRLVREEIRQIDEARKDPQFMALVGKIVAAVAVVYPFLQPISAAMSLVQAAAERRAAKELMAKDAAEAAAAQAEFDKYVAELAALQAESAKLQATPIAPSPSSQPVIAQPIAPLSQPLPPVLSPSMLTQRVSAQGIDREIERQTPPSSGLPSWAPLAAIGAAALVAVPLLMRRGRRGR